MIKDLYIIVFDKKGFSSILWSWLAKLEEWSNIYSIGDIEIHNKKVANVQILPIYIISLKYNSIRFV
jgi:hypothetical protein